MPDLDHDPRQAYEHRQAELQRQAGRLESNDRRLSAARLTTVGVFLVFAWAVFDPQRLALAWLLLPVVAFVALVVVHERNARRRRRTRRALQHCARALARLDDRWAGAGPTGEEYASRDHPYTADLDIFGEGSLFQLLCTARTNAGRARLAGWLSAPADTPTILARQGAVHELAPRLGLREDLAVLGTAIDRRSHPRELADWARTPPALTAPGKLRVMAVGVVAVTLTIILLAVFGPLSRFAVAGMIALQGLFALRYRGAVGPIIEAVDGARRELALVHEILGRVESESFECPALRQLGERLRVDGRVPSEQIGRLRRLVDLLDSRRNQMFAPVGALLLWGTQFAAAVEQWRLAHGAAVVEWLDAIAEIEALDALAAYHFEHPGDPFPEVTPGPAAFAGTALGHPLMPDSDCVRNDLVLESGRRLLIVSGSNMSGKSTLMRTVGINAVLAQAGAPVRADRLRMSPLQVGGSIRVRDSLRRGMSGFYAEIHRFRAILDLTDGPRPVLFLLEEILHTTNSHDRGLGAEALLRSLLERGAIGLVTTHDLAVTELAETLPDSVNVHFVDELLDGQLHFDYRLRPGVVRRSNAVHLMRQVGLEI